MCKSDDVIWWLYSAKEENTKQKKADVVSKNTSKKGRRGVCECWQKWTVSKPATFPHLWQCANEGQCAPHQTPHCRCPATR